MRLRGAIASNTFPPAHSDSDPGLGFEIKMKDFTPDQQLDVGESLCNSLKKNNNMKLKGDKSRKC